MAKRGNGGAPERGGTRGGGDDDRAEYARAIEGREPSAKVEPGMGSTADRGAGERRDDRS